ncbi:MAG: hypothetical protein Q8P81_00110 [Nanoarchaeota archaeon]|nr:hypothetical protein [Nanoarchaeota archaeon]
MARKNLTDHLYIKKNKRGLSIVIATLLMVATTVAVSALVWTITQNLVIKETQGAKECFDLFEKVVFDDKYTCYNRTWNQLHFSIEVKDVEIEKAIIGISDIVTSINIELNNSASQITGLTMYNGSGEISLPEKNSGLTYILNLNETSLSSNLSSLRIAPIIDETQCEVSDSIKTFPKCSAVN